MPPLCPRMECEESAHLQGFTVRGRSRQLEGMAESEARDGPPVSGVFRGCTSWMHTEGRWRLWFRSCVLGWVGWGGVAAGLVACRGARCRGLCRRPRGLVRRHLVARPYLDAWVGASLKAVESALRRLKPTRLMASTQASAAPATWYRMANTTYSKMRCCIQQKPIASGEG
jgi:hypothetical protein